MARSSISSSTSARWNSMRAVGLVLALLCGCGDGPGAVQKLNPDRLPADYVRVIGSSRGPDPSRTEVIALYADGTFAMARGLGREMSSSFLAGRWRSESDERGSRGLWVILTGDERSGSSRSTASEARYWWDGARLVHESTRDEYRVSLERYITQTSRSSRAGN